MGAFMVSITPFKAPNWALSFIICFHKKNFSILRNEQIATLQLEMPLILPYKLFSMQSFRPFKQTPAKKPPSAYHRQMNMFDVGSQIQNTYYLGAKKARTRQLDLPKNYIFFPTSTAPTVANNRLPAMFQHWWTPT